MAVTSAVVGRDKRVAVTLRLLILLFSLPANPMHQEALSRYNDMTRLPTTYAVTDRHGTVAPINVRSYSA